MKIFIGKFLTYLKFYTSKADSHPLKFIEEKSIASFLNPDIPASEIPKSHEITTDIFETLRIVGSWITLSLHEDLLQGINVYERLGVNLDYDIDSFLSRQKSLTQSFSRYITFDEILENTDILILLRPLYMEKLDSEEYGMINHYLNNNPGQVFIVLTHAAHESNYAYSRIKFSSENFSTIKDLWNLWLPDNFMADANLPEKFCNIFLCRADKKYCKLKKEGNNFLRESQNCQIPRKYCYDYEKKYRSMY